MIISKTRMSPRTRQGLTWLLAGLLLATSTLRAPAAGGPTAPAVRAQPNTTQDANQDYNSSTGPSYVLPGWGNLPWAAPQYYTTIQLGDLDGDGKDELIGREGSGIAVHQFDPVSGQWQPVLAADGTILRGPFSDKDGWDQPQYYLTIQLADIDGDRKKELVARSAGGMVVYRFTSATPKAGSTFPAGAWQQINSSDIFSDGNGWGTGPHVYSTIQLADIDGEPGEELVGRSGADGLHVYKWNGAGWTQLAGVPALDDSHGFGSESLYRTIQFADLDGRPGEELLFREANGLHAAKYQPGANGGSWVRVIDGNQPFSDSNGGFNAPARYWTIQTADLDGDGVAEVLGRGQNGMVVLKYTAASLTSGSWVMLTEQGPFTDASGWTAPQNYKTIQLADINGDKKAELLGRAGDGMHAYEWDAGAKSWTEIGSASAVPALADDPWAKGEQYYTTIQTGNVDGDAKGQAELLARGTTGMRTWFWRNNTWTRSQPYGSFPNFTGDQAAAYTALNNFLGIVNGTIRDVYTDPSRDSTSDDLNSYQTTIVARCTGEITGAPPQFQSCTPPPGSGVLTPAWTAVSNQIIAELYLARQAIDHFTTLGAINTQLFLSQNSEFPSLVTDLQLSQADGKTGAANYSNLAINLLANILKLVGSIIGPEGAGLVVAGNALSSAQSGTAFFSTHDGEVFQHTYANIQQQIATIQQQTQTAIVAQKHHVTGDYGLLRTVGELVGSQVWTLDEIGVLSASRYGFTQWVYQTFLPLLWDKWVITNCKEDDPRELACTPPQSGPYMQSTDGGVNFTAILQKEGNGCVQVCSRWACSTDCNYGNTPEQTLADVVWKPVSPQCTYTPGTSNSWIYGQCTLGVGPEIFNDTGGWKFTTRTGDPIPRNSSTLPGGSCNTLCFRAPQYYLGRLGQLPRGTVLVAGNGISNSIGTDQRSEMRLALDGGNSVQDRFNQQFVAAQLSLLAAPMSRDALLSRLSCYRLNFVPVRLNHGFLLSPGTSLGDLLDQMRFALSNNHTADMAELTKVLELLNGHDPLGRCGP